jgi:predicted TPR repeat methyltransferase
VKKSLKAATKGNPRWQSESRQLYGRRQLSAIAARWDDKAATWDQELAAPSCHLNEDEAYPRFVRETLRLIGERKDFCARNGVMDAGCGTGLVLCEIISFFAWGIGVDISSEMIARAKAKRIPRATFMIRDCFEISTMCPQVGAVISRGVLLSHYGAGAGEALLKAAYDALVPGGLVVFDFLNEAGRAKAIHVAENKQYFTRTVVKAMAQHAGFDRVCIVGQDDRRVLLVSGEKP